MHTLDLQRDPESPVGNPAVPKILAGVCGFSGDWSFELVCNHPNTSAAVYKISNTTNEQKFALKLEHGHGSKLRAEARYLIANRRFPFIPNIFKRGKAGPYYFYLMEYLDGYVSFSDLYARNRLGSHHIKLVLDTLQQIEFLPKELVSIEGIHRRHYVGRLENRLNLLKQSYLSDLLQREYLTLNGVKLENIPFFWRKMLPRLSAACFTTVGPIPGDAHFENVFINDSCGLKIIDPNGAPELPLAYDIGKLFHSLNGGYDTFKTLDFDLRFLGNEEIAFSYHLPVMRRRLLTYLNEETGRRWGAEMVKIGYLSELFHFTCLIAHHLAVRKEAFGFYCRTLELIDYYKCAYGYAE